MMWLPPLLVLVFVNLIAAADVGESCVPNNDIADGVCTILTECAEAVRAIRRKNFNEFQRCGFSGMDEIICCPLATNRFDAHSTPPTTDSSRLTQRIADRECQKIIARGITPLNLHIIGGELASVGEFPHMVAIGFVRDVGYEFDCGGSLISATYVLTAAHCVETLERIVPSIVRVGVVEISSNSWNEETDVRITEIITHPRYMHREKYHDLALLKLEKPVEFSSYVNAACLYTGSQDPSIPLTITGWGQTSTTTESRSRFLLKANVSVVPRNKCGESYKNWRKLPDGIAEEQLCAGDPQGLHDTCQGDSGGPLQGITSSDEFYRIIGVTSFGRGCGSIVPGVYTRVSHYLDWIESVVWSK